MANFEEEIHRAAIEAIHRVLSEVDTNMFLSDSVPRAILAALEEAGLRLTPIQD